MAEVPDPSREGPDDIEPVEVSGENAPALDEETAVPAAAASSLHSRVSWKRRIGYGMGHILNDLCASMWFTYLLLFFHRVMRFDNLHAGIVLLIGQIADGMSTLFVGYVSDKGDYAMCLAYGRRKSWHLLGTLCVLISFPFIWMACYGCQSAPASSQIFYYGAFVVIFQFGWASTQISHLAMIPDLTNSQDERTGLTAIRYSATVVSNIAVYIITWIFLGLGNDQVKSYLNGLASIDNSTTSNDLTRMIGPEDADSFRNIMFTVIAIGFCTSTIFHMLVKGRPSEQPTENNAPSHVNRGMLRSELNEPVRKMATKDWLLEPQFYQVAGVYMCTRLFVNLTQVYVPLYLQVTLSLNAEFVAIIPLVMFLFGFAASTIMKPVNRRLGRKVTFLLGALIGIMACVWVKFGCSTDVTYTKYEIYFVAALIGTGGSILLITSLASTAELIGRNTESSAFVYGFMSLTDKLSNGLVVVIIQKLVPSNIDTCDSCKLYYRNVLFGVCGGAALLGALFMLSLAPFTVGQRFRDRASRRRQAAYERLPGGRRPPPTEASERTPLLN